MGSSATTKILPGTWVFRRKRTPDGEIKTYKARYCVRGDLQEGEYDTYAPVVALATMRLFLVLSIILGWTTCSIDFSNAFVQADLNEDVFLRVPRGFRSRKPFETCLKLKKSVYGLSVAPRLWYEHLRSALLAEGFQASKHDPCLLFKEGMMLICYVDDTGIAAKDPKDIDKLIASLRAKGFELTKEGTFSEFLGIKFETDQETGRIHLSQKGLIAKIIETTGMKDCNPNWTPAAQVALDKDEDGEPMQEAWNYPSVVGMLLYLTMNTRPDIQFAVSQVARFNHNPKRSHAAAVKTIIRYLKRTENMGMYVDPNPDDLHLTVFCDADFAGLYGRGPERDETTAKSRTGYLVKLGGLPLIWRSQLQTAIALSTLEAEYQALSDCLRTVIHTKAMLTEVVNGVGVPGDVSASIGCTVFEDNNGALLLANQQRVTSRTKYFFVKWHHFWHHIRHGDIKVVKCATEDQQADYLTKGLVRELFEKLRKLVQGW